MNNRAHIYTNCDDLENLPELNIENYLFESKIIEHELSQNANVLQVGSMDGRRLFRLQEKRPDLKLSGLEIEQELVIIAEKNAPKNGFNIKFITGDITKPPKLPYFDYVICLNNTLGYITGEQKAIKEMKKLGKVVVISVYGEKFNDNLARAYFKKLNLEIKTIENNIFTMKDFTNIKRYTKNEVQSWGEKTIETPIGYLTFLN